MNNAKENWNYQRYLEGNTKNSKLRAKQTEEQNTTNFIKMKSNFSTAIVILLIFTVYKTVESEQLNKATESLLRKLHKIKMLIWNNLNQKLKESNTHPKLYKGSNSWYWYHFDTYKMVKVRSWNLLEQWVSHPQEWSGTSSPSSDEYLPMIPKSNFQRQKQYLKNKFSSRTGIFWHD